MQKYLYEDLFKLEEKHWWHINKRRLVSSLINKFAVGPKQSLQNKKGKILDVGCGTGKNIEAFSKLGNSWGIDTSPEAIEFCKKRGIKSVKKGSIENIPFEKQSFNIITALDVLEHVDDKKSLKEIYRVLEKKGVLIVTVPALPQLWSKWDEVLHHKRRYTKKSLERVLSENNFKVLKISFIYSFLILPVFLIRFVKNFFYKDYYPSDFKLSNRFINDLMGEICTVENLFVTFFNIPIGTSLIAVARKD